MHMVVNFKEVLEVVKVVVKKEVLRYYVHKVEKYKSKTSSKVLKVLKALKVIKTLKVIKYNST